MMTPEQHVILDPTQEDLTVREIMKDCGGDGATKKLAKRKLDSAGFINAHCCDATDPVRMKRMKAALELASSIAEINNMVNHEAKEAKKALENEFRKKAPIAISKLIDQINSTGVNATAGG